MYKVITLLANGETKEQLQPKAPDLKQLQAIVGGYIETVPHFTKFGDMKRGVAYCNEEGLLRGLQFNAAATSAWLQNLGKGPFGYPPRLHGDVVFYAKVKP